MKTRTLRNNTLMPQTLKDGTVLSAAGTSGSTKPVEFVSEEDRRRLITPGHVTEIIDEEPAAAVAQADAAKSTKGGPK
jgi:hypothetical protein